MDAETIVRILIALASFLFVTLIPSIIALINKSKKAKAATTEAEKQAIYNEMLSDVKQIIADTEEAYKNVDALMKKDTGKGDSKGKKYNALEAVRILCLEKGIEFDPEYWSAQIDKEVAFTKKVNTTTAETTAATVTEGV